MPEQTTIRADQIVIGRARPGVVRKDGPPDSAPVGRIVDLSPRPSFGKLRTGSSPERKGGANQTYPPGPLPRRGRGSNPSYQR